MDEEDGSDEKWMENEIVHSFEPWSFFIFLCVKKDQIIIIIKRS